MDTYRAANTVYYYLTGRKEDIQDTDTKIANKIYWWWYFFSKHI